MSSEQQSDKPSGSPEQSQIETLMGKIDKNSDGWDAILHARDGIYKRFFSGATNDNFHEIDTSELDKMLEIHALKASAQFDRGAVPTFDEIRAMIELGIIHEWEKRSEAVNENMAVADTAIMSTFSTLTISELDNVPARPESSK